MSIAIFTDNDFDKTNGVTTTLKALLRHAPPDLRLRVYTLSDVDVDSRDYLALRSLGMPIPFYSEMQIYFPRVREFRRQMAADGVRVIHLTTPGPTGLAARYLASRSGLPLVGSFHTNLTEYATLLSGSRGLGRAMEKYMRWLYRTCETILVPSRDTVDRLAERGWDPAKLSLWLRGVETTVFTPARRSTELRERWRVCERRPAILYAGRVSREKGLDLLEPLVSLLHRVHIAHRLVIVGDGPMLEELKSRCPDAVFTGKLTHDQVATAMASADVMVFPSQTDTAGNVVLEAQACGLPVVVADAGGPRENMRHGETGYVCRSGDAEDFCDRIAGLLRDRSRHAAMSRAARTFAEGRSWPVALHSVYSLYRHALGWSALEPAGTALPAPARMPSL